MKHARSATIIICAVIFAGMFAFSALKIRYQVNNMGPVTEFEITRQAITHDIKRDADGRLAGPSTNADTQVQNEQGGKKPKPCPT